MARIRTLAGGIAVWAALASTASAAPVSWFGSQASLTAWYANQLDGTGGVYSPSNAITNIPATWYAPAPATISYSATTQATQPQAKTFAAPAPAPQADAFVNLGGGPYAESSIMTGNAQPWYMSPVVSAVYGGIPTEPQRADFNRDVLSKVERTFSLSGIDISLTSDPGVGAQHMLSVISGAHYAANPDAIGITQVGDSGFSFIDKLGYASSPEQLASAVANNVAHELMHALGVAAHPDGTGEHVDAARADWDLLTDDNATFSPAAVAMIKTAMANGADVQSLGAEVLKSGVALGRHAAQELGDGSVNATPVPEPATVAVWTVGLLGGLALRRRGRRAG